MLIGNYTRNITAKTKLYYVHIPKTGGTSINRLFRNVFGAVSTINHAESLLLPLETREKNSEYCQNLNFVSAHLPFDFFAVHFRPYGFRSIVTIRNPVEHLISHVSHIHRMTIALNDEKSEAMRQAIQRDPNDYFYKSTMDRLDLFNIPQTKISLGSNIKHVPSNTLDRVSWLLENYDTIVLSEDINKLGGYMSINGNKLDFSVPVENVSPEKNAFELTITDKILDLLHDDILIYNEIIKINSISNNYWQQLVR